MTADLLNDRDEGGSGFGVHDSGPIVEIGSVRTLGGALSVIVIDGAPLERIERNYGTKTHRESTNKLRSLVREACRQGL